MCCKGLIIFIALLVGFAASIFVIYQFYSYIRCGRGKYGPYIWSMGKIKRDILDEARAILKKSKKSLKVTDLGCGSGALLLPLAKEFPHHQFIGLEWDIVPLTMGKIKARLSGLKNITFVKDDYMKASHADMDLIMCYILKITGEPLGKKLAKEIKETAIVISEMFPLYHLEEIKQIKSSLAGIPEKIYVYKKETHAKKTATKSADSKKASASVAKAKEPAVKSLPTKKKETKSAKPVKKVAKPVASKATANKKTAKKSKGAK